MWAANRGITLQSAVAQAIQLLIGKENLGVPPKRLNLRGSLADAPVFEAMQEDKRREMESDSR